MNNHKDQLILDFLKNRKFDASISEISRACAINRITASKYLAVLEARGLVQSRSVGKAKLYSVKR